ncbi:MAG TPA: OmpH family outer membrane protein, partial [Pyrinomonadaceae bacterium]
AAARASGRAGAAAMMGVKGRSKQNVLTRQQAAKQKDEAERKKVADTIEAIYGKTKTQVEAKLAALDEEVNSIFDSGTDAALAAMKAYVEARIDAYKEERYSGAIGKGRWIRDQFKGLPEAANRFYVEGRDLFARLMDRVIVRVANLVEQRLRESKALVAAGQSEIKKYVDGLPKNLKSVGQAAQKEVAGRFKELEQGIEDKKGQLASQLAQKYKEAFAKADKALKEIQDSNKGLVQKFVEKLGEIIKIISEFKGKLMAALRKGWSVIKGILADPIGFLGNLIAALKAGFNQFKANIKTWLVKGLIGWLFGALAEAGVTPPADFSLPSILKLVLQILGITYERVRAKAVKLLGPAAVAVIEQLVKYVQTLMTGGPAALWAQVSGDLADLKERVLGDIRDMIIVEVIKAAVLKIVSMFNPVGAFVQAVLAIYNTVMFVVEQASRIAALVSSVIDSVAAIAGGAIGAAANRIEQALGAAIPIVIGFLARLVGVGGLPKKATAVVKKVQTAIDKAIDKLLGKAIAFVKKTAGKLGIKERTPEEKKRDLEKAGRELKPKVNALMAKGVHPLVLKARLAAWKLQYRLTTLELRGRQLVATINPELTLAEGWTFEDAQVFSVIDKIAKEMVAEAYKEKKAAEKESKSPTAKIKVTDQEGKQVEVDQTQIDLRKRSSPAAGVVVMGKGRQHVTVGETEGGTPIVFEHGVEQAPSKDKESKWQGIGPGGGAKGRHYGPLAEKLKGKPVGDWMKLLATGKPLPKEAEPHAGDLGELYGLMMAKEPSHSGRSHRRDLIYSQMGIDLMTGPDAKPLEQVAGPAGLHPAAFGGAQMGARLVTQEMRGTKGMATLTPKLQELKDKRRGREREMLIAWFQKHKADLPLFPKEKKPTLDDVEKFIRSKLGEIFKR